jgi:hypothetical protein
VIRRMTSRPARMALAMLAGFACLAAFAPTLPAAEASDTTETIVLIRHAEKPPDGLGQITCQGLNRALALPPVLLKAFGKPMSIFAPNPSEQKRDNGILYDYVRPLATIEPAAVAFGLPVHADIGQSRIDDLRRELEQPMYHAATVLIAWEHTEAALLARALLRTHGGDQNTVPEWKGTDFDSIYVVKIHRSGSATTSGFTSSREGLDGQPATCPQGAG